jgi:hypothetical protein
VEFGRVQRTRMSGTQSDRRCLRKKKRLRRWAEIAATDSIPKRGTARIELATSRTQSENHTTRPSALPERTSGSPPKTPDVCSLPLPP